MQGRLVNPGVPNEMGWMHEIEIERSQQNGTKVYLEEMKKKKATTGSNM